MNTILISSIILFFLSEILPFIKSIRGNSMLEIIINIIKRLYKIRENENSILENIETSDISEETQPLITSDIDIKRLNFLIEKLLERLDNEEYGDRSLYLSSIDGQHIELV